MGDSGVGVIEEESEVFLVRNKKEKGGKFQPKHKQTHSPRSSRCTEAPAPVSWAVPCAHPVLSTLSPAPLLPLDPGSSPEREGCIAPSPCQHTE